MVAAHNPAVSISKRTDESRLWGDGCAIGVQVLQHPYGDLALLKRSDAVGSGSGSRNGGE